MTLRTRLHRLECAVAPPREPAPSLVEWDGPGSPVRFWRSGAGTWQHGEPAEMDRIAFLARWPATGPRALQWSDKPDVYA